MEQHKKNKGQDDRHMDKRGDHTQLNIEKATEGKRL